MRDPDRIDAILFKISDLWHDNPDLRLGQLILNTNVGYYTEDDDLLEQLTVLYGTGDIDD